MWAISVVYPEWVGAPSNDMCPRILGGPQDFDYSGIVGERFIRVMLCERADGRYFKKFSILTHHQLFTRFFHYSRLVKILTVRFVVFYLEQRTIQGVYLAKGLARVRP